MFHAHSGWYFKRLDDGSVEVTHRKNGPGFGDGEIIDSVVFDASSWASVVSSVSKEGETGERFYAALAFHGKEK